MTRDCCEAAIQHWLLINDSMETSNSHNHCCSNTLFKNAAREMERFPGFIPASIFLVTGAVNADFLTLYWTTPADSRIHLITKLNSRLNQRLFSTSLGNHFNLGRMGCRAHKMTPKTCEYVNNLENSENPQKWKMMGCVFIQPLHGHFVQLHLARWQEPFAVHISHNNHANVFRSSCVCFEGVCAHSDLFLILHHDGTQHGAA